MLYLNQPKQNVKAYFSTDRGAPTLTNSNLGLIFQACLVEGFGDKEGAGWRTVLADAQENKLPPSAAAATTRTFSSKWKSAMAPPTVNAEWTWTPRPTAARSVWS